VDVEFENAKVILLSVARVRAITATNSKYSLWQRVNGDETVDFT
jgi:hypothetical protein